MNLMVLQNVIQNTYYCLISDMRVERQDPQAPDRFKRRVTDWKVEEKSYRCILPEQEGKMVNLLIGDSHFANLANVTSTNPTITSWLESISYIIVRNWANLDSHLNQVLGVIGTEIRTSGSGLQVCLCLGYGDLRDGFKPETLIPRITRVLAGFAGAFGDRVRVFLAEPWVEEHHPHRSMDLALALRKFSVAGGLPLWLTNVRRESGYREGFCQRGVDFKFTARVVQEIGWNYPESTACESMALILMTLAGYDVAEQLPGEGEVTLTSPKGEISWESWRGPRSTWIEFLMAPTTENYSRYLEELGLLPKLSSNWAVYSMAEARDFFYPKNRPQPGNVQSSRKRGTVPSKGKGGKGGNGSWRANNKRPLKSKKKF